MALDGTKMHMSGVSGCLGENLTLLAPLERVVCADVRCVLKGFEASP